MHRLRTIGNIGFSLLLAAGMSAFAAQPAANNQSQQKQNRQVRQQNRSSKHNQAGSANRSGQPLNRENRKGETQVNGQQPYGKAGAHPNPRVQYHKKRGGRVNLSKGVENEGR